MDGSRGIAETVAPIAAASPAQRQVRLRDWFGFLAMVFGMFMALLDVQIVASSLSEIQAGLAAGADEISWVQTSYLIAEVVMIPLSGFLSRVLATRVLFTLSAASFTVMSFLCALAWNMDSMIVFRAAQGFLGGAMIPTVFATSFALFPASKRAGVTVMIGLVATMAPTLGPTLGGYLTQAFSWHWLFLINIVPGLAVASAVWLLVDVDRPNYALLKGFDFAGFAMMALFLGSLEYVLEEGPRNDWFEDRLIFTFTAICAAAAALFFWRVLAYRNPIVEVRAFADRNFALGSLFSFVLGIGLYGSVYIVPLYLGRVRGYNSLQIGEVLFVTGLFQMVSAPIAGALSKRLDLRLMLALGLTMFGTGVYLTTFLTAQWGFWEFLIPQAIRGASLMLCFLPINTLALGTLPPEKLKNASGLYNLMRNLGGAIGLATINTVITERTQFHWNRLAADINPGRLGVQSFLDHLSARLATLIPGDPDRAAMKKLSDLVYREAVVLTFNDALLLMAAVFAIALLFMPLVRKPQIVGDAGGH
ncbi:MAG TPA: DHA2 family efflux MFS transporter permease subunit [Stellaceae bacterium]|nr:DHA2 family efflux MFS transporter permease subunit [Stellaceae bacterium]